MSVADMTAKLLITADTRQASADVKAFSQRTKATLGSLEARLKVGAERQAQFNERWSQTLGLSRQVGQGMTVAGVAIVGAFGLATRSAVQFNKGLTEVSTLVDTTKVKMSELKDGINDIAMSTGQNVQALTRGMYQAISAGVAPEKVVEFMRVSAKAAVAGVTDTETAVNGITNVINAFGLKTEDATRISDAMFTAAKQGKTTFGELSQSMFHVAPAAAAAGVSMEETMAAISALTASGTPTSVATRQIRAALVGLMRPSADISKAFKAQGFASAEAAIKAKGLKFALDVIQKASGGSSSKLTELLGSVEAVNAAQVLAGKGAAKFAGDIQAQANATGAAAEAFKKMDQTMAPEKMRETFDVLVRGLGDAVLPLLNDALKVVTPLVKAFADFVQTPVGKALALATAGFGALMLVVGPFLTVLPNLIGGIQLVAGAMGVGTAGAAGVAGATGLATTAVGAFGVKALLVLGKGGIVAAAIAALLIELAALKRAFDAAGAAADEAREKWRQAGEFEQAAANARGYGDIAAKQQAEREAAKPTWGEWWAAKWLPHVTPKDLAQQRVASSQQSAGYLDKKRRGQMRASGGPVLTGNEYLVGEKGPELFTPSQSGTIIPAGPTADLIKRGQERFHSLRTALPGAQGMAALNWRQALDLSTFSQLISLFAGDLYQKLLKLPEAFLVALELELAERGQTGLLARRLGIGASAATGATGGVGGGMAWPGKLNWAKATPQPYQMRQYLGTMRQNVAAMAMAPHRAYQKSAAMLAEEAMARGGRATGYAMRRRAFGGPVSGGAQYLVGEQGPELFVPDSTRGTSGGNTTINITVQGGIYGDQRLVELIKSTVLDALRQAKYAT